ncbi:MAG: GNAT family N-acetyltransferase, partial [Saprospiraceae bacterium]
ETIVYLWNREYPGRISTTKEGFDEYLNASGGQIHFLMLDDANEIIGWAYTFDREGDRWFSIIINSLYHGIGLGRMMLEHMKENESRLNGWVIDHDDEIKQNGEPYESPLAFYLKNGFEVYTDIRFENEKMSAVKIVWEKG